MIKPKKIGGKGARQKQARAGERLPYASLADQRTVMLRDGALLQVLHLQGLGFETADSEDLNHALAGRDAALRAIANSRFVVHHHVIRRRVNPALEGSFEDPVCAEIDRRWRARLREKHQFVNDLFVSIVRRPAASIPLGQRDRSADRRVAGKRQFVARREDANSGAVRLVFRRQHEHRFRQVELPRDGLHGGRVEPVGIEDDGQRIAGQDLVGEDIVDGIISAFHAFLPRSIAMASQT